MTVLSFPAKPAKTLYFKAISQSQRLRPPAAPSAPARHQPTYRRQAKDNGADLAFVEVGRKRHYLGTFNSPDSIQAYHRLLAELAANGGLLPAPPAEITVVEVAERFVIWAKNYYRKNGEVTAEPSNILLALRPLLDLYGRTPAAEFGPKALKTVRQKLIEQKVTRRYINRHVDRIKRMFKWAVAEELVPSSTYHGLQAVAGLKFGRSDAPEPDPVRPVDEELIDPVKPFVSRQIAAMIDLQMLTGARPGEITIMRPVDLDTSGEVWIYRPSSHKTQHHGHSRIIPLGPKAREVIAPFLGNRPVNAFLFSPAEAEAERNAQRRARRKTPATSGGGPGTRPGRRPRIYLDHYDRAGYARAIARACELAFPLPMDLRPPVLSNKKPMALRDFLLVAPPEKASAIRQWRRDHHWHPHQLRHNYATTVRREHGLEVAQILLGHAKADVTQVYAERDLKRAIEVARKIA